MAGIRAIAQGYLWGQPWDSPEPFQLWIRPEPSQLWNRPVLHRECPNKPCSRELVSRKSPPKSSLFQSIVRNELCLPGRSSSFRFGIFIFMEFGFSLLFSFFFMESIVSNKEDISSLQPCQPQGIRPCFGEIPLTILQDKC